MHESKKNNLTSHKHMKTNMNYTTLTIYTNKQYKQYKQDQEDQLLIVKNKINVLNLM